MIGPSGRKVAALMPSIRNAAATTRPPSNLHRSSSVGADVRSHAGLKDELTSIPFIAVLEEVGGERFTAPGVRPASSGPTR
jgi:hypothetical protein